MTESEKIIIDLLREISEKLNRLVLTPPPFQPNPNIPMPYLPWDPNRTAPGNPLQNVCPKCGITADTATGYVCTDPQCPWFPQITC